MSRYDLPYNSWVEFYPTIPDNIKLEKEEFKHHAVERLWNLHPLEKGIVNVFGEKETPRWQQSFGRDYTFSKTEHKALPMTDSYLIKILQWVRLHSGLPYNGVLLNWYQDGNHYIGPHSDDEKDLIPNSNIYSFTFGQERDFRIISKKNNDIKIDPLKLPLPDNSLIIMCGETQRWYKHEVPKRALSTCPNRRINITVRLFKE